MKSKRLSSQQMQPPACSCLQHCVIIGVLGPRPFPSQHRSPTTPGQDMLTCFESRDPGFTFSSVLTLALKLLKSLGLGSRNPAQHRGIRNGPGLSFPAKCSSRLRGSPRVQEVAPSLGAEELGFSSLKTLLACQKAKTHRRWCHVNLH